MGEKTSENRVSRQGVHETPRLKAVQQAGGRGAAERRTGEEKRWKGLGKGPGWEDVKQSERERASEGEEEEVTAWCSQVK